MGRRDQLKSLDDLFRLTEWGRGVTAHVSGPSGIGKSALVRRFLDRLRAESSDTVVLTAKCYESEAMPYKAVDDLVLRLSRYIRRLPRDEAALLLPRHFDSLVRLFSSLEPLAPLTGIYRDRSDIPDSQEFRGRAFAAFRELLGRLADRHPLVLFIDDLQWGDLDSAALLKEVMNGPELPPLFLVLAYRSDEIESSQAIGLLRRELAGPDATQIELGPLDIGEAHELSLSLLDGDEEMAAEISREAGRSPFLIEQLSLHFRSRPKSKRIGAADVLRERLEAPEPAARSFLEVLAIAAAPLSLEKIGRATGLLEDLLRAKTRLLADRLIRSRGPAADTFELYHDGLRQATLNGMSDETRRDCHCRLAVALDESDGDSEAIARHYHDAGRDPEAMRFAEIAAAEAESVLAFGRAAGIYRFVLKVGVADSARRREIHRRLCEALTNAGQGSAAAQAYMDAAEGTEPMDALRLRIRASDELLRAGQVPRGTDLLLVLLHQTGMSYPKTKAGALGSLAWERARLKVRAFRPPANERVLTAAETAAREVCWAAAVGTSMVNPINTGAFCSRYLRLAFDSGEPWRLAQAYAAEATQRAHVVDGRQKRAREFLRLAHVYADKAGDARSKAFVLAMGSVVDSLTGRWEACVDGAKEALSLFRKHCRGVAWELTTVNTFLFSSRTLLGRWQENKAELPEAIQAAERRGDKYAAVNLRVLGVSYSLQLAADEPAQALADMSAAIASWPNDRPDVQKMYTRFAEVEIQLYMGKGRDAWRLVDSAWEGFRRDGFLHVTFARASAAYTRGRAALAASGALKAGSAERKRLMDVARLCARELEGLRVPYAPGMGGLVRAGIAISKADRAAAAEHLRAAELVFARAGMAPWVAVARLRLARLSSDAESERLRKNAFLWFGVERIENHEAIANMFCPGDWG